MASSNRHEAGDPDLPLWFLLPALALALVALLCRPGVLA